jgi:hypothetical protein
VDAATEPNREIRALVIAFIQILLTISAVAAIAAVGWRALMARTERPDNGPDNEDQLIG